MAAQSTGACVACPAGQHDSDGPATPCTACQYGQHSSSSATSCTNCVAGQYDDDYEVPLNSIDISANTVTLSSSASGISNGDVLQLVDASSSLSCGAVPADADLTVSNVAGAVLTFSTDLTGGGSDPATNCLVQRAFSAATQCVACGAGYYAGAGATSCTVCAAGKADEDSNPATDCDTCAAGKAAASAGLTACTECAAGQYDGDSLSSTACVACGTGNYAAAGGAGSGACAQCVAGQYDGDSDSSTACLACAAGKYAAAGSTSCTDCAAGQADTDYQVALASIDASADTITLSTAAAGISNGDVLRLVDAPGQTCDAAPLDSDLTVSGVSGAVLTFSTDLTAAGTGSAANCVVRGSGSVATQGGQGYDTFAGYKFWEESTNAAGGISLGGQSYTVEFIYMEDGGDTAVAQSNYEALVDDHDVDILLSTETDKTAIMSSVAEAKGTLNVACCTGPKGPYQQGHTWLFGMHVPSDYYSRDLLRTLSMKQTGRPVKKVSTFRPPFPLRFRER